MLVPAPGDGSTLACTLKILDVGLGRSASEEPLDDPNQGLTGENVLLGTPDYMAPEQARDARVADIRADIYALGCVLYHLLTGQPPFPDTNIIAQMIRHATEVPRPLKVLVPVVPDALQQIVNWMIAKDPAARYATPERAATALEMILAAGSAPASSPDLDPDMQPYLRWVEAEAKDELPPTVDHIPLPPTLPTGGKRRRKLATAPAIDVELFQPAPEAPNAWPSPTTLGRRDLIVFFAGVASGLLAYAAGRGVASLLRRSE